jgi:hypothetical protein
MAPTVYDAPLSCPVSGEIPIADVVISERLPDGSVLVTQGRGRLMPSDSERLDRAEVWWFTGADGSYYRRQLLKGVADATPAAP